MALRALGLEDLGSLLFITWLVFGHLAAVVVERFVWTKRGFLPDDEAAFFVCGFLAMVKTLSVTIVQIGDTATLVTRKGFIFENDAREFLQMLPRHH